MIGIDASATSRRVDDGPLKVLIVDDNPVDAELCKMELRRGGVPAETKTAANRDELRTVLASFTPDVVLCDFSFPDFDGLTAQRIVREFTPDAPLIFVSGTITENLAVVALQSGAVDYVLKSHLLRLPSAVQRAVGESRERQRLEASLDESEQRARRQAARLESLWRLVNDGRLRSRAFVLALLDEAAVSIRPGEPFLAMLRHLDGDDYVIDATCGDFGSEGGRVEPLVRAGTRLNRHEAIQVRSVMTGRSQSWNDMRELPDLPQRAYEIGWRSVIVTQFMSAGTAYELIIASISAPSKIPFSAEDEAYVEVLGSVFARQLELEHSEESLIEREGRTRQHAERLESLWHIVNNPDLRGRNLLTRIIEAAQADLRPHQRFLGAIGRIEERDVVTLVVGTASGVGGRCRPFFKAGRRTALDTTFIPLVGRTQAWDDITNVAGMPARLARGGWRAAISTIFEVGGVQYSLTLTSREPTTVPFGQEDLGYLDVLASSLANKMQVNDLEESLRAEEERSRQHGERLESLWHIVNSPDLHNAELWYAMLAGAAEGIRPGQDYRGMLWRIHGSDLVVEAIAASSDDSAHAYSPRVGAVIPLPGTIVDAFIRDGTSTGSWDDIQTTPYAGRSSQGPDVRSFIITTFKAGAATWGISFASDRPSATPLGTQDHAYMEVLASFFANRAQQSWQFDRIEYQQSHDVLTGLLNRSQFRSQARAASSATTAFAVAVVDVNAFHEINETYGHMVGDALLVEVGSELRKCAATGELVGRVGGDVFAILIPAPASRQAVLERVHAFAGVFSSGFSTGHRDSADDIARSASFGVALAPEDGATIDDLLLHADAALLVAKERGHGSIVCYEAGMEGDAQRNTTLRNEIIEAVARNQFVLFFQPHVELHSGKVSGCEALIRWNHPERGLLAPSHFIPFAEQAGIITHIDDWVMRNAFAVANELGRLRPDFRLYFNLSGRQAGDPKLIRSFVDAARSGVSLDHIGVEITESDAMRDIEATRHVCRALRRLGVKIAIDDFGTGYSSLSFLQRLPVDVIKIDRSFVSGVLNDPHDGALTDAIISIAERFGFAALGEGAETDAEVAWLRYHQCRYVQGYAICYPLPIAAFEDWLAARG